MNVQLLIPAAGVGRRLGLDSPKALVEIGGTPLLVRTLARFLPLGYLAGAVLIVPPGWMNAFRDCVAEAFPRMDFVFVEGGPERQASVANGLARLDPDTELVIIHDAARPFVPASAVEASCAAAAECGASTVAIPCTDTILEADGHDFLLATPDRDRLWACQTPQTFRVPVIRAAHDAARRDGFLGTDDASLVRRMDGPVKLVMGSRFNLKVTTPADLALAELLIQGGLI